MPINKAGLPQLKTTHKESSHARLSPPGWQKNYHGKKTSILLSGR